MKKSLKRVLAAMLTLVMTVTLVPTTAMATNTEDEPVAQSLTMGTKPEDGITTGEPFPKGTGGSNSFRIPAMVTLSDGTLVAAADARWNTTYDGGGLDTIVSRSSDNGATWNYTFANYLGDSGNVYDGDASTAFIDPALAVDGDTIYMLVDLYPYGVALNGSGNTAPVTAKGFDDSGRLLLSGDNHSSYGYYLDGDTIYSSNGTAVSGYTVDEYFNITNTETGTTSNLFFSDSPYKVVRTGFLYLTKSTDGGANWSAPELLNLKTSSEQVCLVAPGRGLVTSNGNVIFSVYSYNGDQNSQTMSYISYDGEAWSRSASMTGAAWSSESAVVELESGALRFFYRNGTTNLCYVDYNNGWGTPVVMSGIDTNSNCQISAITYSKTIDGKQVILVSCPTGPDEEGSDQSGAEYRLNGKIFAFTVESDGSMTKVGDVNVTSDNNQFMYSCLTELSDGTVGILYEDKKNAWGAGDNCYYTMSYGEYDLTTSMNLTFDTATTPDDGEEDDTATELSVSDEGIAIKNEAKVSEITGLTDFVAYDVTLIKDGANYTGAATITIPLNGKFDENATLWGFVVETDGSITYVKDDVSRDTVNDTFTFTAPHFSTVGVTLAAEDTSDTTVSNTVNVRIAIDETVEYTDTTGNYESSYTGNGLDTAIAEVTVKGNTVAGGSTVTAITSLTQGDTFYIQVSDGVYLTDDAGTTTDLTSAETWTAWYVGSNYCIIRNSDNEYLGVGYDGAAYTSSSALYLKMSNGQLVGYLINHAAGTPVKVTTTETVDATDITITGLSKGNTSVVIGTTQYNITVYEEKTITVNYQLNGSTITTETITTTSDESSITVPTSIIVDNVIYTINDTTLEINSDTTEVTVPVTKVGALGNGFVGSTDIDAGEHNGDQTVSVEGKKITEMTVTTGISYDLNLADSLSEGQSVTWTTGDATVATVDENGLVTAVSAGNTVIVATVTNADGTVAAVNSIPITVIASASTDRVSAIYINDVENTTVYCSVNGNTTEPYAFEVIEGELIYGKFDTQVSDGTYTTAFSFFGDPDADHALVYMKSTNSDDDYFLLHDDEGKLYDGTETSNEAYYVSGRTSGAGYWQAVGLNDNDRNNVDWSIIKEMVQWAIDKGCDGGMGFTRRQSEGDLASSLDFVSNPLPKIEKEVDGVLPTTRKQADYRTYTEGMVAGVDELVYFKITITLERPTVWAKDSEGNDTTTGAITYTDAIVSDTVLENAYLYTKELDQADGEYDGEIAEANRTQIDDITTELNAAWGDDEKERVIEFYLMYQITNEDIPKFVIDNVANLDLNYQSKYSKGASKRAADAEASITVVGRAMDNIVIDFGQNVTLTDLTDDYLKGVYTGSEKHTAKYGTVNVTKSTDGSVNKYTVTYTPNQILQEPDVVRLYGVGDENKEKVINGFIVYPATTVYYEEGFVFGEETTENWDLTNSLKATLTQKYEKLGKSDYDTDGNLKGIVTDKTYVYGYDPIYANAASGSAGSYATTKTIGAKGSFTFTGTGFDVYANGTESTGYVMVMVENSEGITEKMYMVNTVVQAGTTNATTGQTGDFYSLPIVSEQGLEYGTYTVELRKIKDSKPVNIDGIRVYGTLQEADGTESVYNIDKEDHPDYYQLRDMVLNVFGVAEVVGKEDSVLKTVSKQIYDASAGATAIITDGSVDYANAGTVQDLLNNGPKNEMFLYKDQTLTFKVKTDRVMQIGLKAPQGETTYILTAKYTQDGTDKTLGEAETKIATSVDMFYKLGNPTGTEYTYTVTVQNTGDEVLAVTDLKICDDPNATFEPLTLEDIEYVLAGKEVEEEETPSEPEVKYADASLTINLTDDAGEVIASTSLTANGVVGESATFTAVDIKSAVESLELPAGYKLKKASYSDKTVAYGEEDTVTFTAEKKKDTTNILNQLKNMFSNLKDKLSSLLNKNNNVQRSVVNSESTKAKKTKAAEESTAAKTAAPGSETSEKVEAIEETAEVAESTDVETEVTADNAGNVSDNVVTDSEENVSEETQEETAETTNIFVKIIEWGRQLFAKIFG